MKKNKYKNSCLFIYFGENKKIVDLLKIGKFSIGISSQFTDLNFNLFKAGRKEVEIDFNYIVDFNFINSMNYIYAEYIEQLTRWNISDNNFSDPIYFYEDFINSINYWYNFLKFFDIDTIYIYEDPHRAYDLLIYALAKQLNIKVFIFSELNTGYRTFIKQNITDTLLDVKGEFLLANKAVTNELKYNHFISQFEAKNFFQILFSIIKKVPKILNYHDTYIYSKSKLFIKISTFSYMLWKINRYIKTLIYKYHYKKYSKSILVSDQDIVFFLHYQPERTSNPLAGSARDQLYCIKMLKKTFPEKKIYVKEHPSHLNLKNPHQNRQFRDKKFLYKVFSISDGLVDKITNNSKFIVATLNGTAGLEYSLKGHNVICFGNPWYKFLQNVYHVKSSEDLINITFKDHSPHEIEKKLNHMLYHKSAKGSVSNKHEKIDTNKKDNFDDTELLNYVKWYFNI